MKKKLITYISFILFITSRGLGQSPLSKPLVDEHLTTIWPNATRCEIHDYGRYSNYKVYVSSPEPYSLHVKSLISTWFKQFEGVMNCAFFAHEEKIIFLDTSKILHIQSLGSEKQMLFKDVESFKLLDVSGKDLLLYLDKDQILHLLNTKGDKELSIKKVISFAESQDLSAVIVLTKEGPKQILYSVTLPDFKQKKVTAGIDFQFLTTDNKAKQIAYLGSDSLYFQATNNGGAKTAVSRKVIYHDISYTISSIKKITNDRKGLLLTLKAKQIEEEKSLPVIWSYSDTQLKSSTQQKKNSYLFYFDLAKNAFSRIEDEYQSAELISEANGKIFKIREARSPIIERSWNKNAQVIEYLFNLETGNKVIIDGRIRSISEDGKFLIIQNKMAPDLSIYSINQQKIIPLTKELKSFPDQSEEVVEYQDRWKFAGWLGNDKVLAYDNRDIWLFDVLNSSQPVCLTNKFGVRNNITFRFAKGNDVKFFTQKDISLLAAFNNRNKQNGFYSLPKENGRDPLLLTMDDHYYGFPIYPNVGECAILKAKKADVWIVNRERADSSPNYYETKDFKSFKAVSACYPEKNYNWLTTDLIDFKTTDGQGSQGILYKPENFDSTKKYPVIIRYYEKVSNQYHIFRPPQLSDAEINIPWFVSRGYLVFSIDIMSIKQEPGPSALMSAEGAAEKLSTFGYVDKFRIGLCGHSFGAYETNYIITHSKKFAAAVSASGFVDLVNDVGSVIKAAGENYQTLWAEAGQGRIGYNMWQRPDLYIKNSPIYDADKVTSPLLLLCNDNDGVVNYTEGLKFFIALRRLNKIVWMLSYPGEYHLLATRENQFDYTQRLEDFYGHYLKGEPKKPWMK